MCSTEPSEITELPILHLDDDFVVFSKPGWMAVHRDSFSKRDEQFAMQTISAQTRQYVYPVHRLDRQTSGVMCFALTKDAARALQAALLSGDTRKDYLTLVRGETPEAFESARPLKNDRGEPRPARTEFRRLATFSRCSLLAARLFTGRKHQIRRHLSHLAHQIIGDASYGKGRINAFFRETYGLPRMFLHARRLTIAHPRTNEAMTFEDPLPDDLRGFLGRLPDVDEACVRGL